MIDTTTTKGEHTMSIPTCPREDCTATKRHYHRVLAANPNVDDVIKCNTSPDNCQKAHDLGNSWVSIRCYSPRVVQPTTPTTAPVMLPTVKELARVIFNASTLSAPKACSIAESIHRLIAERVPVWQPVEPGTVIKAGTHYRSEWYYSTVDESYSVERVASCDFTFNRTDQARYYIDPRTIPADPDADLIESVAEEMHANGGCDAKWPCASHVESLRKKARNLIEAVREYDRYKAGME